MLACISQVVCSLHVFQLRTSYMRVTFPAHLIVRDLVILVTITPTVRVTKLLTMQSRLSGAVFLLASLWFIQTPAAATAISITSITALGILVGLLRPNDEG
jgi:hypothetical protein